MINMMQRRSAFVSADTKAKPRLCGLLVALTQQVQIQQSPTATIIHCKNVVANWQRNLQLITKLKNLYYYHENLLVLN